YHGHAAPDCEPGERSELEVDGVTQDDEVESIRVKYTAGCRDARERLGDVRVQTRIVEVDDGRPLALQDAVVHEVGREVFRQTPVEDVLRRPGCGEQSRRGGAVRPYIPPQIGDANSVRHPEAVQR